MGLFDAFSGRSGRLAPIATAQRLDRTQQQGLAALQQGQQQSLAALGQGQTNALGALDAGMPQSIAALGQGYDTARQEYGNAREAFTPWAQTGLSALGGMADAAGLNGQAGHDRSVSNFRASPGYQYQVDQATDQVARKASALGVLGSGNTMAAITDRASHLADQEYGSYLDRLGGLSQLGYNATGQQAALTKGIGDLGVSQGSSLASLFDTNAARKASIFGNTGAQSASIFSNTGAQSANLLSSLGQMQANNLNQGMLAGQKANENSWNALLKGAEMATKLAAGFL